MTFRFGSSLIQRLLTLVRSLVVLLALFHCLAVHGSSRRQLLEGSENAMYSRVSAAIPQAVPPQIEKVPTTIFRDAGTGVAFRYPVVWTIAEANNQNGYLPPAMNDIAGLHLVVNVVFSPDGNFYQNTNLQDLSFAFGAVRGADAAACRDLVGSNQELDGPVHTVKRQGITFTEATGGDGAMSHLLTFTMDSTWRAGVCLLFERDEATIAPDVQPGKRALSSGEDAALQRHLRYIFESIVF